MNEIKVASLSCSGEGGMEASLERARRMIEEACCDAPDLICLPEIFPWTWLPAGQKVPAAEPVGGRVGEFMSDLAAAHRVNILSPLLERADGRVFNSTVWFDRNGEVLGVYRKVYPTDYEMGEGITPGNLDFGVFDTEFGKIGCCICFDLNFRDVVERIADQGAGLVVFPSMFQGVYLMQAWAKLYGMHFISASDSMNAASVNPLGVVTNLPWSHGPIMNVRLNLDYVVLHTDYNAKKFADIKAAYGPSVEIEYIMLESSAMLSSRHPEKTAKDIAAEFGLELEKDYYRRSSEMRQGKLSD